MSKTDAELTGMERLRKNLTIQQGNINSWEARDDVVNEQKCRVLRTHYERRFQEGRTSKEVAEAMGVSRSTLSRHAIRRECHHWKKKNEGD